MRRDTDSDGVLDTEYFYHTDDMYNVVAVTNASGAVVERYEYGPYGAPTFFDGAGAPLADSAIGNPYLWNGRRYDPETGLYYYRLRYLDPELGRFTTLDPIELWGDAGNMGNGYAYVGNRPWAALDPFGLSIRSLYYGEAHGLDSYRSSGAPVGISPRAEGLLRMTAGTFGTLASLGLLGGEAVLTGGSLGTATPLTGPAFVVTFAGGWYSLDNAITGSQMVWDNQHRDLMTTRAIAEVTGDPDLARNAELFFDLAGMGYGGIKFVTGLRSSANTGKYGTQCLDDYNNGHVFIDDAIQSFKGGSLSKVGRALTKHPELVGHTKESLRTAFRTDGEINTVAERLLRDMLNSGKRTSTSHPRYGRITTFQHEEGFGVRFESDSGTFIGFINP